MKGSVKTSYIRARESSRYKLPIFWNFLSTEFLSSVILKFILISIWVSSKDKPCLTKRSDFLAFNSDILLYHRRKGFTENTVKSKETKKVKIALGIMFQSNLSRIWQQRSCRKTCSITQEIIHTFCLQTHLSMRLLPLKNDK